ncbi:MAG: hypothetical protein ACSHWW_14120 [Nonlabens sp.]|uniref:hypothetical protein n=1 Tax=Nonlabens sp. TaxID=1888209 RepID=UPI003EF6810C
MIIPTKKPLAKKYLEQKKYLLTDDIKKFLIEDYSRVTKVLYNYFEGYKYIYCTIEDKLKTELKYDVADHLEQLYQKQEATKYKVLLKEYETLIINFNGLEDIYVDYEDKLLDIHTYVEAFQSIKFPYLTSLFKNDEGSFAIVLNKMNVCNSNLTWFFTAAKIVNNEINNNVKIRNTITQSFNSDVEDLKISLFTDHHISIDADTFELYYLKGYKNGQKTWEEDYYLPANRTLDQTYLQRLKHIYFKKDLRDLNNVFDSTPYAKGCSFVKSVSYKSISLKGVEQLGYYSALTFNIDELVKELEIEWFHEKKENKLNNYSQEIDSSHPTHNPNLWNEDCFKLFKYLHDNYYKSKKRELTNIWFYLKEYDSNKYVLKSTKKDYITFIEVNYKVKIKNFDKAPTKYNEKEYPTINEHRMNFEDSLH